MADIRSPSFENVSRHSSGKAEKMGDDKAYAASAKSDGVDSNAAIEDLKPLEFTEEEGRRVLRKIDMVLMPLLSTIYTLQYIDKSALSYAAVFTIREDANLSSRDYSWLGTLFYLGYLVFEFPGSALMQKTRTNYFMGAMIIIWGICLLCMAFPRNFAGFAAVRFLLGAAESVVTPGFALICARFYLRQEQPLRTGIWYSCNGLGSMIGGLIGWGCGHIVYKNQPEWVWIFYIAGSLTILAGIFFLWACPNSPLDSRFLTPHERRIAVERIRSNQSTLQDRHVVWRQVREALNPLEDPQGWLLFLATFCLTVPNGGIGTFLHLILQEYGYDAFQTILLGLPTGAMQVVFVVCASYIARRFKNMRIYVSFVGILFSLVGVAIQYATTNTGARLYGYYTIVGFVASLGQAFMMPAANVNGYTKRIVISAMVFIAYGAGNSVGPQFWKSGQNPPYHGGMLTCIVCFCLALLWFALLRLWYMRENRRRDRLQGDKPVDHNADFSNLTDCENLSFRYQL